MTKTKTFKNIKSKNNSLPVWDLSKLYKNITDPQVEKDFLEAKIQAELFAKKYRGKINAENLSSKKLLEAIEEYQKILVIADKPVEFSFLLFAQNSKLPAHGAFLQKTKTQNTEIYQEILFFTLDLSSLDIESLKKFSSDPILSKYKHFLQRIIDYKPHRLSEAEEKLMADKSLTGRGAFVRLFDQETSKKLFKVRIGKKTKLLTQSETLDLFHDSNRKARKAAAEAITEGLAEELDRLTFISNILIEDKRINDKYQKFETPEDARHLDNEIEKQVVDTMVQVITKNYKLVQDYYQFKRKVLGLKYLEAYDIYAPVTSSRKKYSYSQARDIVLESFKEFSPEYYKYGKEFFDNNWVDVGPKDGKRGGAFCSFGLPDTHPVILLNYTENIRQVLTLAHELGHGVHARFFKDQPYLNFDTPLTIAETSSVFAEILVFDSLRNSVKNRKELFSLYMGKIEDILATVFRQVGMFKFEREFHKIRREKGELTSQDINEIWQKSRVEMFGNSVRLNKQYNIWWSYIPHFVHSPFYVYAYAFGELLTLALYMQYKKQGSEFTEKYINFLRAGGSKSPNELLKELNVDLNNPQFWQDGIDFIKDLVEEAKQLYVK